MPLIYVSTATLSELLKSCDVGESVGQYLSRLAGAAPAQSRLNERAVLACIKDADGPLTASNVHHRIKLSKPTVARCLSQLLTDGLVKAESALINNRPLMTYSYVWADGERRRGHFLAASRSFSSPTP